MTPPQILLTGGSGYVGALIAASLLESTNCQVIAAVRAGTNLAKVRGNIENEVTASRRPEVAGRFLAVTLPGDKEQHFASCLREHKVSQVVHCAGCVDYFAVDKLFAANVELTRKWLAAARVQKIDRLIHISTAFSAGCTGDGVVREELHADPVRESTVYMKTKRESERLVVESDIPFVILRPSILVGDSQDGHYYGKPYGVYQLWKSAERLLCDKWRPAFHIVAPRQRLHVLHQDHFTEVFLAAFHHARCGSIINVVSEEDSLPSCREIWNLYSEECLAPESVTFYDTMQEVSLAQNDRRISAFLASVATNIEISSTRWRFDTANLRSLCEHGYHTPRATLESLHVCQRAFVAKSRILTEFISTHLCRPSAASRMALGNNEF